MRLTLSSAAAPDLPLPELLEACSRRGFDGVELVSGHAHGVGPGLESRELGRLRRELAAGRVRLAGLYLAPEHADHAAELARLSIAFGAPLVAPVGVAEPAVLARVATIMAAERGTLLLRHDTEGAAAAAELAASIGCGCVGNAWQLDPHRDDPALASSIAGGHSARLRYVRLLGGGPEAARQAGLGVGALMARLALARFAGPLVLCPSDAAYHYAWSAWLGRAGRWGCGSRAGDTTLHSLQIT